MLVRDTADEKSFSGAIVTVDVPELPAMKLTVVGFAFMVKSGVVTVTVTVIACFSGTLVPVTVTV